MEMLDGLHDRALAIDGANLHQPSELVRDDNKKRFGADAEREGSG